MRQLKREHNTTIEQLLAQQTAGMNGMNTAQTARNKLLETSDQYREMLAVSMERGHAMREIEGDLAVDRRQAEAQVMAARARVRSPGDMNAGDVQRNLKTAEAWLARIDEKIAENRRIADRASRELETLEAVAVAQ